MDHDDESFLQGALQNVSDSENLLHDTQIRQYSILTQLNSQTKTLSDNQQVLNDNLKFIKESMQSMVATRENRLFKEYVEQADVHVNDLVRSLEFHISKIQNAILFLKAGIIDPFFIEPNELIHLLNFKALRYNVQKVNVDNLLRHSSLSAAAHTKEMNIIIVLKVPVASQKSYALYENFVLPKLDNDIVVVLAGAPRYFAISVDRSEYLETSELRCFNVKRQFICKQTIIRNLGMYPSCVSSIFVRHTDNLCQYKKVKDNFVVHNIVNHGVILFSSVNTGIKIKCESQFNDTKVVNGSVLISVPDQCTIESDRFVFD